MLPSINMKSYKFELKHIKPILKKDGYLKLSNYYIIMSKELCFKNDIAYTMVPVFKSEDNKYYIHPIDEDLINYKFSSISSDITRSVNLIKKYFENVLENEYDEYKNNLYDYD